MGWQRHKDTNNRYYTRKVTQEGRQRHVYVGRGPQAELIAALDAQQRAEREAAWSAAHCEAARLADAAVHLELLTGELDWLVRAGLLAEGFHQPDAHWRRRRDVDETQVA